jgi:chorismate dehydratase
MEIWKFVFIPGGITVIPGKERHITTLPDGAIGVDLMRAIARIGTVPYLNAMPLTLPMEKSIVHSKFIFEIIKAPPSRLAYMVQTAGLDIALLSVVEPMKDKRLRILSEMCICSNGPTLTVQIFHKGDLSKIQKLGLDSESKTSNILAQVILQQKYGIRPERVQVRDLSEKTLDEVDAFVSIGDKTFNLLKTSMDHIDLGEAWLELTGLPIVWCVWVMAPLFKDRDIITVLRQSNSLGLQMIDEIVPRISRTRDIPMEVLTNYFHKNVHYKLGTDEKKGVAKLFELAHNLDLLPPPRRLEYYFG